MERFCAVFKIVPGSEEEFRRRHVEIWPEMRAGMTASGFSNYSLFRRSLDVISYGECEPSAEACFARFGSLPVAARWNDSMAGIVRDLVDGDGNLFRYDEVWHLD